MWRATARGQPGSTTPSATSTVAVAPGGPGCAQPARSAAASSAVRTASPYPAATFASMLSQIAAERSVPSNRASSCRPVGEVTLISVR